MKNNFTLKILVAQFLLTFLFSCRQDQNLQQNNSIQKKNDSISFWTKESRNKNHSLKERSFFLTKVYKQVNTFNDSIKNKKLSSIAYQFIDLKDSIQFFKINKEVIELANKFKDTFIIADANWSYAEYFLLNDQYVKSYKYYNKSFKLFDKIKDDNSAAKVLRHMAVIKNRYHDYTGSEVLLFEAIKRFKKLNLDSQLYHAYNNLALMQVGIKQYDKSLKYHQTALKYLRKVGEEKTNYESYSSTYNNIGLVHLLKEDYTEALRYLNLALNANPNLDLYATIISNAAYSRLKLGDTLNVKNDFFKVLKLKDSLNNKGGIISVKIRISKYYNYLKDSIKALKYVAEANNLAKDIKDGGDYLKTLKLLSKIDQKNSEKHLENYIKYNDSLIAVERKYINKFTRIEFETDEVIKTNEVLTKQRIWIFACSIGAILILSLLYLVRVQRAKNEKLFLETEQQKANEQVYLLTLKQQATLEEEKTRERNRISQELHDGILGRLFGTRVGMGFLDIGTDEETQKQHQAFLDELQEIEKEIREVSHKLNTNFEDPDVNFTTIINQLLESKSQIGDFRFHLDIDQNISWKSTDEIIKVNVYRIIQEALQNTIKHANAQNVTLDFSSDSSQLTIRLKDDGKGFSMKKSKKGIGLKNIRSRVQKMNGTIDIVSAIGKGTEIHIKIPISQ